jgi:hypothetical protein
MTYEEAMLLAIAGYPVRRIAWHSPKQFVRYVEDSRYNPYRSGWSGGWYPKDIDLVAEDWDLYDNYPEIWNGWYYPWMRKREPAWYYGLGNGRKWHNYLKAQEEINNVDLEGAS